MLAYTVPLEGDLLSISIGFTSILQENVTFRYSIVMVSLVKTMPKYSFPQLIHCIK